MRTHTDPYRQAIADEWWAYYLAGEQVWAPYVFRDRTGYPVYVGHSNAPHLRFEQHQRTAWWWRRYLDGGTWEVLPQRFDNEADSDAYETYLIHTLLPLCNVCKNEANPHRIIPARRARAAPSAWAPPRRLTPVGGVSGPLVAAGVVVAAGLGWSALSSAHLGGGCLFWSTVAGVLGWAAVRRR